MPENDFSAKKVEEKMENLKYEIAQEMGLENKDEIEPPEAGTNDSSRT